VEVLFERMAQLKVPQTPKWMTRGIQNQDLLTHLSLHVQTEIDNSVDNPEVIKRYEELVEEAARAKQELDVVEDRLQNFEAKNRERIEAWKENATMVTGKLHDSFKKFMEALQYHGEVKMVETGAISEYEMQLMVSFRDTEGMRQLSGTRHSGGERAVSTVMYLMALQVHPTPLEPIRTHQWRSSPQEIMCVPGDDVGALPRGGRDQPGHG